MRKDVKIFRRCLATMSRPLIRRPDTQMTRISDLPRCALKPKLREDPFETATPVLIFQQPNMSVAPS